MSGTKIISRQRLPNGLTLELRDLSRPAAGDRWLVSLEARLVIPVAGVPLPPDLQTQTAAITKALGNEIVFSQKDERNFIAAGEVPSLLDEMATRFMTLVQSYWGRPDFPGKFIRKKYLEYQERQRWRQG